MPWNPPTKYFPRHYTGSTVRDGTLYHYGKGLWMPQIVRDGQLDPAHTGLLPGQTRHVLWLSTHPVWEATVNIGRALKPGQREAPTATFAESLVGAQGHVRFVLAPSVVCYDFATTCAMAHIAKPFQRGLGRVGRRQGAHPADWYGTFDVVTRAQWLRLEVFEGDHWQAVPVEAAAAARALSPDLVKMSPRAWEGLQAAGLQVDDLVRQHQSGQLQTPHSNTWARAHGWQSMYRLPDGSFLALRDNAPGGTMIAHERDFARNP